MTEVRLDLNWRLFADLPDEPETHYGLKTIVDALHARLSTRYAMQQVDWLRDRGVA
jgi:hypothetical protein